MNVNWSQPVLKVLKMEHALFPNFNGTIRNFTAAMERNRTNINVGAGWADCWRFFEVLSIVWSTCGSSLKAQFEYYLWITFAKYYLFKSASSHSSLKYYLNWDLITLLSNGTVLCDLQPKLVLKLRFSLIQQTPVFLLLALFEFLFSLRCVILGCILRSCCKDLVSSLCTKLPGSVSFT